MNSYYRLFAAAQRGDAMSPPASAANTLGKEKMDDIQTWIREIDPDNNISEDILPPNGTEQPATILPVHILPTGAGDNTDTAARDSDLLANCYNNPYTNNPNINKPLVWLGEEARGRDPMGQAIEGFFTCFIASPYDEADGVQRRQIEEHEAERRRRHTYREPIFGRPMSMEGDGWAFGNIEEKDGEKDAGADDHAQVRDQEIKREDGSEKDGNCRELGLVFRMKNQGS
ncbi:hypothetical protein B0H63DRAFT_220450 [Podospora didyma]|uniref:Uncharacterized protein n=1 Tax=Podospora didyma TaxID=330526 RepID=A0AAE0KJ15_9PEZI|nr:hypothetical protein B0H63DRAFT_220450 [Podospora didyma]